MLEEILKKLMEQVLIWAQQYPIVATILMVVGVLRFVMKPVMDLLRALVLATPGTGDDEFLAKVEGSKAWQYFLYILDWLGSIKTPTRKALERKEA